MAPTTGVRREKEDQYADDFVADDNDLSIVDDDADSEEDEFEKGLRPRKPRRSSSKLNKRRRRPRNRIKGRLAS